MEEKKGFYDVEDGEEVLDDYCDLEPGKICNNCEKCLNLDTNYKIIKITKIVKE